MRFGEGIKTMGRLIAANTMFRGKGNFGDGGSPADIGVTAE